jgi:broad specificity phosphatase PhoE
MPSILLIRHAQASFGTDDYDVLSDTGRHQVSALVAGLHDRGIVATKVVSGDLRRQRDTAVPCAHAFGIDVSVDPRWNEYVDRDILSHHATVPAGLERHAGDEPLSSRQFQEILNDALTAWIDAGSDGPCQETWPAFQARLSEALGDVADSLSRGDTAVVVSSGGAIAAVCADLMGLPPKALIAFNHVSINAAISKLTVGRAGISLISVNEHGHLERAGRSLVTYR